VLNIKKVQYFLFYNILLLGDDINKKNCRANVKFIGIKYKNRKIVNIIKNR